MSRQSPKIDLKANLARNVRAIRVDLGMTQEMLAESSGLHQTYLSDVERGKRNVTVQIPAGVIATGAKPVAGWSVETIKGKYAATYDYRGAKISEGITEVDWSGGKLPDKTRQEFEIETFLTDSLKPGSTLYFPAVQECEQGVSRWIEIPANGAGTSEQSRWPAPAVKLTAP